MVGKWILLGAFAVLIGLGAGAFSRWRQQREETNPPRIITTDIAPVEDVSLEGVLSAPSVVSVPAPIEGVLEMVMVNVGDEVYENQFLAQIQNTALDTELLVVQEEIEDAESLVNGANTSLLSGRLEASRARADLTRARGILDEAQRNAGRQRMLYRQGATPRQVYEKSQTEYTEENTKYKGVEVAARLAEDRLGQAQKDLEDAQWNLADLTAALDEIMEDLASADVVSPVTGVLTGMAARQGEEVHPGMESLFLVAVDLTRMQVILEPTSAEMDLIRPGQSVTVHVAEAGGVALEGTVTEMTVGRAIVDFVNPTPDIRPGFTAVVRVSR